MIEISSKKRLSISILIIFFIFLFFGIGYLLVSKSKNTTTENSSINIKTQYIEDPEANKEIFLEKQADGLYETERTYESKIFTADFEFNAVSPTWTENIPSGTTLDLYLRLGSNDNWSGWLKMIGQGIGGKDGAKSMGKSPEVPFFHKGNNIQYKVVLKTTKREITPTLKSIKLKYIDSREKREGEIQGFLNKTKREISNLLLISKVAEARWSDGNGRYSTTGSVTKRIKIISRAEWGCPEPNSSVNWGNESKGEKDTEYSPVKKFIIHHTAGPTSQDSKADMLAIWEHHKNTKGWGDIGYNYVIDKQGNIYEGRYGGLNVVARHTKGYNVGSLGIAIMGDYTSEAPTEASLQALNRLIIWKNQSFGIKLDGKDIIEGREGHPNINSDNITGHKSYFCTSGCESIDDDENGTGNDWNKTPCPGTLMQYLSQLRTGHIDINAPTSNGTTCSLDAINDCAWCDKATRVQKRLSCLGMWGIEFKEKKKEDDPTLGQNRLDLIDGINKYIKDKYPTSPFRKLNDNNPGALFVSASEQDGGAGINPLILLAVSAATTNLGTISDPVIKDCGNPWGQKVPVQNAQSKEALKNNIYTPASCTDSSGAIWYEFNKNHEINKKMVYKQAEIMKNTYVQDYTIRSLGGNENVQPPKKPGNDPGFVKKYNINNGDVLDEGLFIQAMEDLLDATETNKYLKCSGDVGDGGGDLANANAMSEEQIECYLKKKESPWIDTAKDVKAAAVEFNINPAFLLAIAGQESTWGKANSGASLSVINNNPGNVKYSADYINSKGISAQGQDSQGHTRFTAMVDGWRGLAYHLRVEKLDKGATTLQDINHGDPTGQGRWGVYAEDPDWWKSLDGFMQEAYNCI